MNQNDTASVAETSVAETSVAAVPSICQYCNSPQSSICKTKRYCTKPKCPCKKADVACICGSFNNNKLHWAVLSYIKGFRHRYQYNYFCACCDNARFMPTWDELHSTETNNKHLHATIIDKKTIMEMIKNNPALLWEKNICGITPITLIEVVIEILYDIAISAGFHTQVFAEVILSSLNQLKREVALFVTSLETI